MSCTILLCVAELRFSLIHSSKIIKTSSQKQGRSQDFSVGTHSFPSHLFTPPPPQKKKIKVIFDSRVFYFKYININIFEIYFFIYFFILFIYLFFFIIIFRYAIAYLRTGSYAPEKRSSFNSKPERKSSNFSF